MISRRLTTECYVYITLPGKTEAVTAGRFQLTADRRGDPLGRFIYGKSYLDRPQAVPIDPVELTLAPRAFETTRLKGLFGALRDAGPDFWGRTVIERHAGRAPLGELDYLLESPDDRAGALGFGRGQRPPAPKRQFSQTIRLANLQTAADTVIRDEELPADAVKAQVDELLLLGSSMGGARPKAVVEDDDALWVAKFNRPDDRWNMARVEHAMLLLARACGLVAADSKIVAAGGRDILLVKRFDRRKIAAGYLRSRMVSALTLLRSEDTAGARDQWSYVLLAEELRRVSAEPRKDANELFRRMCFNALISNTDDHPRNHAILAPDEDWGLAPAYDLVPSTPVSIEHRDLALICGDAGRFANAENLLSQSRRFLLEPGEASRIIDDMKERVKAEWYKIARREGVSERDCGYIADAFAYQGFDLPLRDGTR
jgi:serine/threonine-protein kinase HipA